MPFSFFLLQNFCTGRCLTLENSSLDLHLAFYHSNRNLSILTESICDPWSYLLITLPNIFCVLLTSMWDIYTYIFWYFFFGISSLPLSFFSQPLFLFLCLFCSFPFECKIHVCLFPYCLVSTLTRGLCVLGNQCRKECINKFWKICIVFKGPAQIWPLSKFSLPISYLFPYLLFL